MSNLLVIGYGNPLCGDDGVAWHVVNAIAPTLPPESVAAIHQLTPEWAEPISRTDLVIFVDAAVGDTPGEVNSFPLMPQSGRPGSHEMTPMGLLGLAVDLFGRCPAAHMVTITGDSFDLSETLSVAVSAAVPEAARLILNLLENTNAGVLAAPPAFDIV
jgi:hydrogenase maturation protease